MRMHPDFEANCLAANRLMFRPGHLKPLYVHESVAKAILAEGFKTVALIAIPDYKNSMSNEEIDEVRITEL